MCLSPSPGFNPIKLPSLKADAHFPFFDVPTQIFSIWTSTLLPGKYFTPSWKKNQPVLLFVKLENFACPHSPLFNVIQTSR